MIRSSLSRIKHGVKRRAKRVLDRIGVTEPEPAGAPQEAVASAPVEPTPTHTPSPTPQPEPEAKAAEAPVQPEPAEAPAAEVPADDIVGEPLLDTPQLTRDQVWDLFEDMVRPALQADGGDIVLVNVENNDVFVQLVGACSGCPSSTVTMRMGIERLLQEEFPHFNQLIQLDELGQVIENEAF